MAFEIKHVTKEKAKLRLALSGPSGSGKTWSALEIARELGGPICLFDTEYNSAAKYASEFTFDGALIEKDYHPQHYIDAIAQTENDYNVVILDSLSHGWNGPGGVLELVSAETKRKGGNSYAAWDTITPIYRRLIQSILGARCHVIVTLRAKQDYLQEVGSNGRTSIKKVGMAPEIREGFSYEMDIEGLIDIDHNLIIGKTRCPALDGKVFNKPGKEFTQIIQAWLSDGAPAPAFVPPVVDTAVPKPAPAKKAAAAKVAKPTPTIGGEPESPAFPLQNNPTSPPLPAIIVPKGAPEWWESLVLLIQYNNIEWSDLDRVLGSTSVERADGLVRPNASQITAWLTERQANGETLDTALSSLVGQAHSMKDVA